MAVRKGVLTALAYSTDYDGNPANVGAATWTTIPVLKILSDQAQLFREEAVTAENVAGLNLGAAVRGSAVYPVIIDDADTFLAAIRTAASNLTPIWFRETIQGQDPVVCGGAVGGIVNVADAPSGSFGSFGVSVVNFSATGANAGDTYDVIAGT